MRVKSSTQSAHKPTSRALARHALREGSRSHDVEIERKRKKTKNTKIDDGYIGEPGGVS